MKKNNIIIIGAGPAGLTAAIEILEKTDYLPIILEGTDEIGGISRTVKYKGNRMDIGGHRFFSKSDWVMNWWLKRMPLTENNKDPLELLNVVPESDNHMLVRSRLSRIFYLRKFFNYPISLSAQTIKNLGLNRIIQIGLSYVKARIAPIKNEKNLEEFFINRFGKKLYLTFFKSYTEKVWGVPCSDINPDWGAQRIKGLSITSTIVHALKKTFNRSSNIQNKNIETSLIEQFYYPKLGPGQMWELVAQEIESKGGKILKNHKVTKVSIQSDSLTKVLATSDSGVYEYTGSHVISTMPVKELINALDDKPDEVLAIANELMYRDFITVGVLVNWNEALHKNLKDNWIYIQEPDVYLGRLQIFNNWSPALVKEPDTVWLGLEYFANEGDYLWNLSEDEMKELALKELIELGFADTSDLIDSTVIKVPKAYPAYFGSYNKFDVIKEFTNSLSNLYLIGRNGMHRYNNQDHSMLSAKHCVECILDPSKSKESIWGTNSEQDYHEEAK